MNPTEGEHSPPAAALDAAALSSGLIDCYFGGRNGQQLVKHQIDSFNDFIARKLDQIIEGFNPIDICNTYLPSEVEGVSGCYKYVLTVSMHNPTLSKPVVFEKDGSTKAMLPNDARLRNLTYAAPLSVDVCITAKTWSAEAGAYISDSKRLNAVSLGRIPIMVRSRYCVLSHPNQAPNGMDECRYDYGGYFVINGSEKVVISQDRIAENRTYVFLNTKASCYSHVAEIRSVQEERSGVPKTLTLKLSSKANSFGRTIKLCMHHIKHDVPVVVMFRALGVVSDRDVVRFIVQDETGLVAERLEAELVACLDESSSVRTTQAAQEYLAMHMAMPHHQQSAAAASGGPSDAHRMGVLRSVLRKDLLPHVGQEPLRKALYLGHMVGRLLRCHLGLRPLDDRDSYINKRLDTPGALLANLFRQYYGKVVKDMRALVQKDINGGAWRATNKFINVVGKSNVYKLIKPTIIEAGLKYGLATGNWGVKTSRVRQGVAQVLNRMTYVATLSHLRRINTPIEKTGKLVQPRKLHPTQWGVVCPSETPEGASVGLVKNMALLTHITVATPSEPVRIALDELGLIRFDPSSTPAQAIRVFANGAADAASWTLTGTCARVFVNGDLLGVHADPVALVHALRDRKRSGTLSAFLSVAWAVSAREVSICTEGGRFVRPLLVASTDDGGRPALLGMPSLAGAALRGAAPWHELVLAGAVEYLDVDETNGSLIGGISRGSSTSRPTHYEVSPCAMLGVVAGSIPYSDHNQAPRNTYQSAMGKQAIGIYASNFRHRLDTMAHVLSYPQRPMVSTHTARILNCDSLPCGINTMVAIACFTGFNQEDSVIVNRSAVERGLFVSTFYRTFREQNNKNHSTGEEEFFCRPDASTTRNMKSHNYAKLGGNGFVEENKYVEPGDVVIGKCMPQKQGHAIHNKDTSVALKSNERGFVDRNCHSHRHFPNTTSDGYTFAKLRLRQERVPSIGDKVSCYTGDHEVLTERHGWLAIGEVCDDGTHRVASLLHDGSLAYQVPSRVQHYAHAGLLVRVVSSGVDLLVTPEHRLWVSRADAAETQKRFAAVTAAEVAYGTQSAPDGSRWHAKIALASWDGDSERVKEWQAVRERGLERGFDSEMSLTVIGRLLASCDQGCRDQASLPQWIWNRPRQAAACMLAGLLGPGMSTPFSTRSKALAGQLQRLALHAGCACDVTSASDESLHTVSSVESMSLAAAKMVGTFGDLTAVFCCTVPEGPGVIFVRRAGKAVWCGNSRHGQKGTIGMLYREENMPFTTSGMTPSIIINPHAIPSRMTIGQLMEALESKAGAMTGSLGDASPFNGRTVEDIAAELDALGAHRHGDEVMYNPRSGEQLPCAIFMCPTYYQRLKHMVEDKVHSRSANGPVVLLTRQPAEGRARDGGLRLGEMELECLWAHGSMYFLKERFMECSDNYRVFVCTMCGMMATVNPERGIYFCKACKNITEFAEVRMPYAAKLLMQEIHTMSIGAKFIT